MWFGSERHSTSKLHFRSLRNPPKGPSNCRNCERRNCSLGRCETGKRRESSKGRQDCKQPVRMMYLAAVHVVPSNSSRTACYRHHNDNRRVMRETSEMSWGSHDDKRTSGYCVCHTVTGNVVSSLLHSSPLKDN